MEASTSDTEPPVKMQKLEAAAALEQGDAEEEPHAMRRLTEVLLARGFTQEEVNLAVQRNSQLVTYRYLRSPHASLAVQFALGVRVFEAERRTTRKRAKSVAEGFRAQCSEHPAQEVALPRTKQPYPIAPTAASASGSATTTRTTMTTQRAHCAPLDDSVRVICDFVHGKTTTLLMNVCDDAPD